MTADRERLREFFSDPADGILLDGLDLERVPTHVAVIMDGNGRWAAKRNLPRLAGHRAGAQAVREAILTCIELGIEYLTVYSFSSENWSRPKDEVNGLMALFVEVLERELENLQKMGVRVVVAGRAEDLPAKTARAFAQCEHATANNTALTFVVALNYGGRAEIVDAVRAIAEQVAAGALEPADISEETVAASLYTAGLPDPDLVVRTSGEMRISNFLLWQIAYSELYVTDTLWPDFDRHEMLLAVVDFAGRTRRFGGR